MFYPKRHTYSSGYRFLRNSIRLDLSNISTVVNLYWFIDASIDTIPTDTSKGSSFFKSHNLLFLVRVE